MLLRKTPSIEELNSERKEKSKIHWVTVSKQARVIFWPRNVCADLSAHGARPLPERGRPVGPQLDLQERRSKQIISHNVVQLRALMAVYHSKQ